MNRLLWKDNTVLSVKRGLPEVGGGGGGESSLSTLPGTFRSITKAVMESIAIDVHHRSLYTKGE